MSDVGDPFAALAAMEGVPSALTAARDGIDARLRDRGRRATGPETTAESLLRGAAASALLAGSTSTLEDLRAGRGDDVATSAGRVSTELLGQLATWRSSPVQVLARLHVLTVGSGDRDAGRPASGEAASRLHALAAWLMSETSAPALSVAAMVHAEVASAAAFGGADGIVARAAERLMLVDRGVDPASVTVPEAGHAADPAGYEAALGAYATGTAAGVRHWLLHAARAYAHGAEAAPLPPRVRTASPRG